MTTQLQFRGSTRARWSALLLLIVIWPINKLNQVSSLRIVLRKAFRKSIGRSELDHPRSSLSHQLDESVYGLFFSSLGLRAIVQTHPFKSLEHISLNLYSLIHSFNYHSTFRMECKKHFKMNKLIVSISCGCEWTKRFRRREKEHERRLWFELDWMYTTNFTVSLYRVCKSLPNLKIKWPNTPTE